MNAVTIVGAGPAGASAAIAARLAGAEVTVFEKSRLPRHKVCGEFLSPEIAPVLERLDVWSAFHESAPAILKRMELTFGSKQKSALLPEPAWGLSRFCFDRLLADRALQCGAELVREPSPKDHRGSLVVACGRRASQPRGARLFGFKAHFSGPARDAVELFFFGRCYVGISAIENGRTNVCGIAPEDMLRRVDFRIDEVLRTSAPLAERLSPLTRTMPWLTTGPLVFGNRLRTPGQPNTWLCGDALSFVDPFTGSGLLAACATGSLAGHAAAMGASASNHLASCQTLLSRAFSASSLFRSMIAYGWAEKLVGVIPARWLYSITRPRTCA
jgi:hypothetical protein